MPANNAHHAVLLLHGMLSQQHDMAYAAEVLRGAGYAVLNVDCAGGYLNTVRGTAYNGRLVLRFARSLVGRERYTRLSMLGQSFGGVVLRWALGNGLLELFPNARPTLFASSVAPHLGVLYNVHPVMLTGLGLSGRELAWRDAGADAQSDAPMLERLSTGRYLEALARFDRRLAIGLSGTRDYRVHVSSALVQPLYYAPEDVEFEPAMRLAVLGWDRHCVHVPLGLFSQWTAHSDVKFTHDYATVLLASLKLAQTTTCT